MLYSLVMPAHNEEGILETTVDKILTTLQAEAIPTELILVEDNSTDATMAVAQRLQQRWPGIRIVQRTPPGGFGRAVRSGLEAVTGDVVAVVMADDSDDPRDIVAYYRKIEQGYDCVFGSRFRKGSVVKDYPWLKRLLNRLTNKLIQLLFWTRFNDITNAFKAYRTEVIRACGPYTACHFNITIEMSLSALIRKYNIAEIPIHWYGRTWGSSSLRVTEMGRRYLAVLLKIFFERMLVSDDLLSERVAYRGRRERENDQLRERLEEVESRLAVYEKTTTKRDAG
ncbi:MAG: glycosyltransferase family 2 protein [Planctomycetes bacterium]|nr:glycosyltransferase family 2 protein [Planctomycetota bacterium]